MRRVFRIPFTRGHIAREVDDELAFHLEMRTQRLIAMGLTPDAARREALRQFGDLAAVRDDCVVMDHQRERTMHRADVMGAVQQDVVYALRTLKRNIGFTAIIVSALALGIGANTAIFTLIDAVLVRTLPVAHPNELVAIGDTRRVSSFSQGSPRTDLLSYPLYRDVRDRNQLFTGVFASGFMGRFDVRIERAGQEPEHPRGRFVTANYFNLLGVRARAGRVFDGSEDRVAGASPVAVISDGYWTRRFHNDPGVVGREIVVQGVRITIIGVASSAFTGEIVGFLPDIWIPASMHDALNPHQRILDDPASSWLLCMGRLKPGVTLEQAERALPVLMERSILSRATGRNGLAFTASKPKYFVSSGAKGFSRVRDTFHAPLLTLMFGVALLLCIICANVANLLLARAIARGREMAVRLALGANRARLVRQLLTESLVLAAIAGAFGLLIAVWASRALLVLASGGGSGNLDLGLDGWVLGFTVLVSVGAVLLFGLLPALRASRVDLSSTMRGGAPSLAGSLGHRGQRAPLGKLLISGQVALSVVLLVGASMLVRSLRNVQAIDVGMDRDHLLIVDLDVTARGYSGERLGTMVRDLSDRLTRVPGVAAVTFSENGIFSGTESGTSLEVPGFIVRSPDDTSVAYDQVGAGYVHAIGGRLIAGRDLDARDEGVFPRTAIVNETLAKFYFPGHSAVGQYLHFNDTLAVQIVGVLADTRDHELEGSPSRRVYFPYLHGDDYGALLGWPGSLRFEVRTVGDPAALVQNVRKAVVAFDPELPTDIDPLRTLMRESILQQRLVAQLSMAFGVLALLLAGIGLYGVMTYAITRRTAEIGLRVALGAPRGAVVRMVLVDALRLVGIGVLVGLPLALMSMRLIQPQLHGIDAVDPPSIAAAVLVLAASAVVAVLVPAIRAAKVSPIAALRSE